MYNKEPNFMDDIKKTLTIADRRRKAISEAPTTPLKKEYLVNKNANILHPNFINAIIESNKKINDNTNLVSFKVDGIYPPFRGGEYLTVSMNIDSKVLTRPYSIFSSSKEAKNGIVQIALSDSGYFSHALVNAKEGTKVILSEPSGSFYRDSIRDKDVILGIAGGTGITPFVSMMKQIASGANYKLNLVVGVKNLNDLIIDLDEFKHENINIEVVLSDEIKEGYSHGFITKDILKKYVNKDTSIYMCGPNKMYEFVAKELESLGVDRNSIRCEHNRMGLLDVKEEIYDVKVKIRGDIYNIKASSKETLHSSFEKAGIIAPFRCESGVCGLCHTRVISGSYYVDKEKDARREADIKFNYIHPCVTYPKSNMELDVPPVDKLKELL